MKNTEEVWKYVPQFDGFLQASNLGNLREFVQILKSDNRLHIIKKKLIEIRENGLVSYQGKVISAPRLIFSAFYTKIGKGYRISFRDGNNQNRKPENLMSESTSLNAEENYQAKLSSSSVYKLCLDYVNGFNAKALSEKYNIHYMNVYRVIQNNIWKSVERPKLDRKYIKENKEYLIKYFNNKIKKCNQQ